MPPKSWRMLRCSSVSPACAAPAARLSGSRYCKFHCRGCGFVGGGWCVVSTVGVVGCGWWLLVLLQVPLSEW